MHNTLFLFFLFSISLGIAQGKGFKEKKQAKFLDITVQDPVLQNELDQLKKEYLSEMKKIKAEFKEKRRTLHAGSDPENLKADYKERRKSITQTYKARLRKIKEDYKSNKEKDF